MGSIHSDSAAARRVASETERYIPVWPRIRSVADAHDASAISRRCFEPNLYSLLLVAGHPSRRSIVTTLGTANSSRSSRGEITLAIGNWLDLSSLAIARATLYKMAYPFRSSIRRCTCGCTEMFRIPSFYSLTQTFFIFGKFFFRHSYVRILNPGQSFRLKFIPNQSEFIRVKPKKSISISFDANS